jgi:hypothetical protein
MIFELDLFIYSIYLLERGERKGRGKGERERGEGKGRGKGERERGEGKGKEKGRGKEGFF